MNLRFLYFPGFKPLLIMEHISLFSFLFLITSGFIAVKYLIGKFYKTAEQKKTELYRLQAYQMGVDVKIYKKYFIGD